jgi:hypothetical protein
MLALSFFFEWNLTTEAMGIWRFAGAFAVVERQSECGSKTAGMHVSQPMNIGVCYGLGAVDINLFLFSLFQSMQSHLNYSFHPKCVSCLGSTDNFLTYYAYSTFNLKKNLIQFFFFNRTNQPNGLFVSSACWRRFIISLLLCS